MHSSPEELDETVSMTVDDNNHKMHSRTTNPRGRGA